MGAVKRAAAEKAAVAEPDPPRSSQSQFGIAREIARRLNDGADALSGNLARAEKALAGLGLGVKARVNITTEEDAEHNVCTELAFQRSGPHWGLFIVLSEDYGDGSERETPLLSASKDMRVRAAQVIPDLLAAMIEAARKQAEEIEAANRAVLDALRDVNDVALSDDPFGDSPPEYDDVPF